MATWELVGEDATLASGGERLARVRRAGTRQAGWTWVGGPIPHARSAGLEPGSEMTADRRVWGSRTDAELRCHLGLLDDCGQVTGA